MNKFKIMLPMVALLLSAGLSAQVVDPEPGRLTGDGPYIIYQPDGRARVISVSTEGQIVDTLGVVPSSFNVVSHDGRFSFDVALHDIHKQPDVLDKTAKTCLLSDPHGRLDCFVSALQACGVVDSDLKWCFGPNRLVLDGDVMDRGDDVTQIFWLLYKLEEEAAEAGGSVSFLYGNHEPMVLAGDLRYTREKYKALADSCRLTVPLLYGPDTEIGRWIQASNAIIRVGEELVLHAGYGPDLLEEGLEMSEINEICARGLFMTSKERKADSELMHMMFKSHGPVWYRGYFSKDVKWGARMDNETLDEILERCGASRIWVGHTIFKDIRSFYGGRVVAIDVDARINHDKGRGRAVILDEDGAWIVRDSGKRKRLKVR